ncbi:hypothetical protein [Ancylomarina sp. 16SWW S1-10-2]|uniref:hypothetical protein n=1 Tax=Ancylomarina sp. 16SWW S1-10-2 TaxID=2499681 RepID=UPI0012AD2501|nr:hypothetical protein [Ancylomarina sp. 16SWW S1-10-2]MRT93748.1 hypothetical protein [Ancylomarina sp. 16SWW S1-10-2]
MTPLQKEFYYDLANRIHEDTDNAWAKLKAKENIEKVYTETTYTDYKFYLNNINNGGYDRIKQSLVKYISKFEGMPYWIFNFNIYSPYYFKSEGLPTVCSFKTKHFEGDFLEEFMLQLSKTEIIVEYIEKLEAVGVVIKEEFLFNSNNFGTPVQVAERMTQLEEEAYFKKEREDEEQRKLWKEQEEEEERERISLHRWDRIW